jgi:hypothetical protein
VILGRRSKGALERCLSILEASELVIDAVAVADEVLDFRCPRHRRERLQRIR